MMQRIVFASDLDNTLLFSRKYAIETDICVEHLEGRPQGYLTQDAPWYLERIMQRGLFIPVTSRSMEQYRRIQFPDRCRPQYAVTTNGAVLLINGEMDRQWYQESLKAVSPWKGALEKALQALSGQPQARRCRMVDEMFVFAACDTAQDALAVQKAMYDITPLNIEVTGRKIYFFPPQINKGAVIPKLRSRFQADCVICAGDSSMDIPMLEQADIAIVPDQSLMKSVSCGKKVVCTSSQRFYEFVLREAAAYMS